MGMKEFLPESDFVYGLRTVLCDASSEFWHLVVQKWKKKKIQIFAKNTNIHLHTSSLFHENEKLLTFIRVNRF